MICKPPGVSNSVAPSAGRRSAGGAAESPGSPPSICSGSCGPGCAHTDAGHPVASRKADRTASRSLTRRRSRSAVVARPAPQGQAHDVAARAELFDEVHQAAHETEPASVLAPQVVAGGRIERARLEVEADAITLHLHD